MKLVLYYGGKARALYMMGGLDQGQWKQLPCRVHKSWGSDACSLRNILRLDCVEIASGGVRDSSNQPLHAPNTNILYTWIPDPNHVTIHSLHMLIINIRCIGMHCHVQCIAIWWGPIKVD